MDSLLRQQRLAELRQKLAALTTEVAKTEDELTALESDEQLNLGATPVWSKNWHGHAASW